MNTNHPNHRRFRKLVLAATLATTLLTGLAAGLPAAAAADAPITVQTVAQKEVVTVTADGKRETRLVPLTKAVPGDEIVYTVSIRNSGAAPATNLAVDNPVPEHTVLVPDSAGGAGFQATYSVDGGRTHLPAAELKVREADGTVRAARADEITHLRLQLANPLPPGTVAIARYRVTVR